MLEKGALYVKLTARSVPGHSSSPPLEENCISILSKALHTLEKNPHPLRMDDSTIITTLKALVEETPWLVRLLICNLWLFRGFLVRVLGSLLVTRSSMRTTTALTVVRAGVKLNSVPAVATGHVNHRVHPQDSCKSVLEYDRKLVNDPRVKLEPELTLEPSPIAGKHGCFVLSIVNLCIYSLDHRSAAYHDLRLTTLEIHPDVAVAPGLFPANTDSK